jgi:hypothetical protein
MFFRPHHESDREQPMQPVKFNHALIGRKKKMKKINLLMAILVIGVMMPPDLLSAQYQDQEQHGTAMKEIYTCPMHPEVSSDKPGKCPRCGMTLVKKIGTAKESKAMGEPKGMNHMMDKPIAEKTVDGLRVQLWLIPQDEHKKIMDERMKSGMGGMKHDMGGSKDSTKMGHDMGGMKDDMKGMDHSKMDMGMKAGTIEADKSKMKDGTHHVMVKVLDDKTGKAVGDGHIMIAVTAPSGKSSTIHLSEMMDHFGGGASLTEKGAYKFALSFKSGDKTHKAQFELEVK